MSENKRFESSETSHVGYTAKKPDLADKTFFKCGRTGHLRAACTSHDTNSQVPNSQRKPNSGNGARIFYCNVPPASTVSGVAQLQGPSQTVQSGPLGTTVATAEAVVGVCSKAGVVIDWCEPVVAVRGSACPSPSYDVGITVVGDTVHARASLSSMSECTQTPAKLKLERLDYVNVTVEGIPHSVSALIDGGSQFSRGQRNSAIRFGIGISKTEPYRTELFIEFRKSRNSDYFGIALRN